MTHDAARALAQEKLFVACSNAATCSQLPATVARQRSRTPRGRTGAPPRSATTARSNMNQNGSEIRCAEVVAHEGRVLRRLKLQLVGELVRRLLRVRRREPCSQAQPSISAAHASTIDGNHTGQRQGGSRHQAAGSRQQAAGTSGAASPCMFKISVRLPSSRCSAAMFA